MRFEGPPVTPSWRKARTEYRLLRDPYRFGFIIEAPDRVPESPRLWLEGGSAVIHHSPGLFLVLPDLSLSLIEEIAARDHLTVLEQHRQRYNEGIVPGGMDRGGSPVRSYDVPIIHVETIGDIRKIFNGLPEDNSPPRGSIFR